MAMGSVAGGYGFLWLLRQGRLVLRLMADPRVPFPLKLLIPAAILYLILPFDLAPDFLLGIGQLDDLFVLLLALLFFLNFSPRRVVEEHLRNMNSRSPGQGSDPSIEASYRVMDDDERPEK